MKLASDDLLQMKGKRAIPMLTAYTCPVAREFPNNIIQLAAKSRG